jgi:coenzyme F420-reducing hydrogenase gamma subunit
MTVPGLAPDPRPTPNPRRHAARRPRVGVVKFASCDGCQLTLLDLEDELLDIAERFDIVEFAEATSNRSQGPFDVLLVEGSISTPGQAEEIVQLRRQAAMLVTIGACATAGGIQALRNLGDHDAFRKTVYPRPDWIESLPTSKPVSEYVAVDAELYGCPISGRQLLELLTALSVGRRPQLPDEAVCAECKRLGNPCILVAQGVPCLGPVTRTGCGALCPSFERGCYGCFGPREAANSVALAGWFSDLGRSEPEVRRLFAGFTVDAPAFRAIVEHGPRGEAEPQEKKP